MDHADHFSHGRGVGSFKPAAAQHGIDGIGLLQRRIGGLPDAATGRPQAVGSIKINDTQLATGSGALRHGAIGRDGDRTGDGVIQLDGPTVGEDWKTLRSHQLTSRADGELSIAGVAQFAGGQLHLENTVPLNCDMGGNPSGLKLTGRENRRTSGIGQLVAHAAVDLAAGFTGRDKPRSQTSKGDLRALKPGHRRGGQVLGNSLLPAGIARHGCSSLINSDVHTCREASGVPRAF